MKTKKSFYSFEDMMITTLFKFIYFIGFWIIIAASFALIGIEINGGEEYAFLGLAILTIGNIIWRVFCESLIVIFKIHENIGDIRNIRNIRNFKEIDNY